MTKEARIPPFVRGVVAGVFQAALWVAAAAVLILVVPQFARIFADFDAELPAMTRLMIAASDAICGGWHLYWYIAVAPIVAWPLMNGALMLLLSSDQDHDALWTGRLVTWGAPVLVLLFLATAILLPLATLISRLS